MGLWRNWQTHHRGPYSKGGFVIHWHFVAIGFGSLLILWGLGVL